MIVNTLIISLGFLYTANSQSCVSQAFNLRTIKYYDFLTTRIASTGLAIRYGGFNYLKSFHAQQLAAFQKTGCDFQFPKTYTLADRNVTVADFLKNFKNNKGEPYSKEIIDIVRAVDTIMWYGGQNRVFATCALTVLRDGFLKMQERCLHDSITYETDRMQPVSLLPDVSGDPELQLNLRGYVTLEMLSVLSASACPQSSSVMTAVTQYSQRDHCDAIKKAYGDVCRTAFKDTCPDLTFCHTEFISNPDPNLPFLMKRTYSKIKKCREEGYTPPGAPTADEIWRMAMDYAGSLGFAFLKLMRKGGDFERELSELMDLLFHVTRVGFNADVCRCVRQSARVNFAGIFGSG